MNPQPRPPAVPPTAGAPAAGPPAEPGFPSPSPQQTLITAAHNRRNHLPAAPDAAPLVRLVGVCKRFGALTVLRQVSLDLRRGQNTVIIGPSGTGKSVLLKHIVGLLRPDQGQVWYGDQRVDQLDDAQLVELRKKIGFLFQMGALFDSMNVLQNVIFPLEEHLALDAEEMRRRGEEVLRLVGLTGIGGKMPADLSGGQRKRVALARAIVLRPEMVLYDEPTTGLDPIRADLINELIVALSRHLGITSVVVTHDMASAGKIADRLVMLYDGRIVADGDPATLHHTDSDIVQRFIRGQAEQADLDLIHDGFAHRDQPA